MAAGARSAAVGIGTGSVRLIFEPVATDGSPVDDQAHAIVDVGELDMIAPGALDRRLPPAQLVLAPSHDGRPGRQVDRAAMRQPRLDQLEPDRARPGSTFVTSRFGLQRQVADPVRLHPCAFLVALDFVEQVASNRPTCWCCTSKSR